MPVALLDRLFVVAVDTRVRWTVLGLNNSFVVKLCV